MTRIFITGVLSLLVLSLVIFFCFQDTSENSSASRITDALNSDNSDLIYEKPARGKNFDFPKDHGAHNNFRLEWWYFTGFLHGENDRQFGYQLTFFRFSRESYPEIQNAWNNDQTWMAHFAVSDIQSQKFYFDQEFARQSLDLAGADSSQYHVWVNSWKASTVELDCDSCLSLNLTAKGDKFAIDLIAQSVAAPILQGDSGYSPKNKMETLASYYYSYPNMKTSGTITIGDQNYFVEGISWMDREWSSGFLQADQIGWDWFSLHFDDGRKVMYFQIRQQAGDSYKHAVLIDENRNKTPLEIIEMRPTRTWTSPATKISYPIHWQVTLHSADAEIKLEIKSLLPSQELNLQLRYYEGLMKFKGTVESEKVSGYGYMELTGY